MDVATGHTTTLAGSVPGFQDGEAHQAAFHYPNSVAVSPDGGFVFVSDAWNHRIRAVVLGTGVVTTVAGKGFPGFKDGGRADARTQQRTRCRWSIAQQNIPPFSTCVPVGSEAFRHAAPP